MGNVFGRLGRFKFFQRTGSPGNSSSTSNSATKNLEIDKLPQASNEEVTAFLDGISFKKDKAVISFIKAPFRDEDDFTEALRKHDAPEDVRKITVTKCYHLRSVPNYIGVFKNITTLSFKDNAVETLPWSIVMLKSLILLDLSYNLLTELPKTIGYLTSLEILYLQANFIKQLPTSLLNLEKLKQIDVSQNPKLVSPPLATCAKGIKNIREALSKRIRRTNVWEHSTPWFKDDNENYTYRGRVKPLLELSISTVIECKVDFIGAVTVPPVVKAHLAEEEKVLETRVKICKCDTCKKFFSTQLTFDDHLCH